MNFNPGGNQLAQRMDPPRSARQQRFSRTMHGPMWSKLARPACRCFSVWNGRSLCIQLRCAGSYAQMHATGSRCSATFVLPSVKRTKEEIRTGKVRQFKARMCLIAHEPGQMATLVVDDHVLFWFRNRFYRANQFAAAFAILRRYSQYPKHLIHHWAFHVWVKT